MCCRYRADPECAYPQVRSAITANGIRIYAPPIENDDAQAAEHAKGLIAAMPFSIIGSTQDVVTADGRQVKGREYLWGVAEGERTKHNGAVTCADNLAHNRSRE